MPNMLDYLKWRGDLSFDQDPFNEIDNLILTRFSYLPLEKLIKEGEKLKIKTIYERFQKSKIKKEDMLLKEDWNFFEAIATANRFRELVALKYVQKISLKLEEQFAVITILLPKDTAYISFCGTDISIVGWKENFNMSFKSHLPAQKDAVSYLNYIGERYAGKLMVGGHSKGGNLAVYAAAFCKPEIQKRITVLYNNDGPGFSKEIIESKNYKNIVGRVISYVPQSSVIGRLLFHEEKYYVVKSNQIGIMQHDPFSWVLHGPQFHIVNGIALSSHVFDKTVKTLLGELDLEKRRILINTIAEIIQASKAQKLSDLQSNFFENSVAIISAMSKVDPHNRDVIINIIKALFRSATSALLTTYNK